MLLHNTPARREEMIRDPQHIRLVLLQYAKRSFNVNRTI